MAMIVFVPVYILALHEFEAPLIIPKVEQDLVNILYLYLGIMAIGIFFRVLLRGNDLETDKTIKALAQRNKELETMVASLSVENKGYGEQIANLQKNFNLILKEINKLKGIQEENP